jgi:hypothetical protein
MIEFIVGVFVGVCVVLFAVGRSLGSFGKPCGACGVKLYGEGLPSVNWRHGKAYSYCYECGTEQHRRWTVR